MRPQTRGSTRRGLDPAQRSWSSTITADRRPAARLGRAEQIGPDDRIMPSHPTFGSRHRSEIVLRRGDAAERAPYVILVPDVILATYVILGRCAGEAISSDAWVILPRRASCREGRRRRKASQRAGAATSHTAVVSDGLPRTRSYPSSSSARVTPCAIENGRSMVGRCREDSHRCLVLRGDGIRRCTHGSSARRRLAFHPHGRLFEGDL